MPFFGGGSKDKDGKEKERSKTMHVPFLQPVRGGQLLDGKALGVKGKIKGSFAVNLMTGSEHSGKHQDDRVLHVNYREKTGWVVNALIHGKWETEDTYPIDEDIKSGDEVYVRIEPHDNYFEIFANGQKIGQRRFSKPLNTINHIYVEGKIELHRLSFEGSFYMVPFEHDLNGFRSGRTLYITGRPEANAKSFEIKLCQDDKNIPLYLNPRFNNQSFVRNSLKNNKWEDEERDGDFPFFAGQTFDLIVDCKTNMFEIFVDGHKVCNFYHRLSPDSIMKLEVDGNVEVQSIYI